MNDVAPVGAIIVGVDGSEASIEALRQAQKIALPLGARLEATAFWDFPQVYGGYVAMGIDGFEEAAGEILKQSLETAFGPVLPGNVASRLVQGHPRESLIEASR